MPVPKMSVRLTPHLSPSVPESSIDAAKTRLYADTIHCCAISLAPSKIEIAGSATLKAVVLAKHTSVPRHRPPKALQTCLCPTAVGAR